MGDKQECITLWSHILDPTTTNPFEEIQNLSQSQLSRIQTFLHIQYTQNEDGDSHFSSNENVGVKDHWCILLWRIINDPVVKRSFNILLQIPPNQPLGVLVYHILFWCYHKCHSPKIAIKQLLRNSTVRDFFLTQLSELQPTYVQIQFITDFVTTLKSKHLKTDSQKWTRGIDSFFLNHHEAMGKAQLAKRLAGFQSVFQIIGLKEGPCKRLVNNFLEYSMQTNDLIMASQYYSILFGSSHTLRLVGEICYHCRLVTLEHKKCQICGMVVYCSKLCQRADWKDHRKFCRIIKRLKKAIANH